MGVHVGLLGKHEKDLHAATVAVMVMVMCQVALQLQLKLGCSLFQASTSVLETWKRKLSRSMGVNTRFRRRLMKSLKPIAWPAGTVGIIDDDMKISYLQRLLGHSVDMVMYTNEDYKIP